jgi:hypothetical protein
MWRTKMWVAIACASVSAAIQGATPEFEFESKGVCDREIRKKADRLVLKRLRDGLIRARVTLTSYCLGPSYVPQVEYSMDHVKLQLTSSCEQMAIDLSCKMELTFRLLREVARGTEVVVRLDSNESQLRAIAP